MTTQSPQQPPLSALREARPCPHCFCASELQNWEEEVSVAEALSLWNSVMAGGALSQSFWKAAAMGFLRLPLLVSKGQFSSGESLQEPIRSGQAGSPPSLLSPGSLGGPRGVLNLIWA